MKRIFTLLVMLSILCGFAISAHAVLINRGGGMIYSTDLNVTWLQDANYARTSGYDADGLMNWNDATAWASNLVYGGYDDWRLPIYTGSASTSYTEMGYLTRVELGNPTSPVNIGPFFNVQFGPDSNIAYWTGTEGSYDGDTTRAWRVLFDCG